jgi:hypothetical protein
VVRVKIGEAMTAPSGEYGKRGCPTNHRQHAADKNKKNQVMAINNVNNEELYN